jgi:hypothetical protein
MEKSIFSPINFDEFIGTSNLLMLTIEQEIKKGGVSIIFNELGFSDSDLPCQKIFKFVIISENGSCNKVNFEINVLNIEITNYSFCASTGWYEVRCKVIKNQHLEELEKYLPEIINFLKS